MDFRNRRGIKNVLITGCAGFIGSNFMIRMIQEHPDIRWIGIDKMTYCSSDNFLLEISEKGKKEKKGKNYEFIKADICNLDFMNHIFDEYEIDAVVHFAAYSHVDNSFGNSLEFSYNNIIGTHTLLEVARKHKSQVKIFVSVSTDEIYSESDRLCYEDSTMGRPSNPYSASKYCSEAISMSYFRSFGLPIIVTRSNNVYGPRQYPEKVIPKFIKLMQEEKKFTIQGSGQQRRSFIYIDDVVNAFSLIMHNGRVGEIYNIGTNIEYTVLDIANKLLKLKYGPDSKLDFEKHLENIPDREFNDSRYYISTEKMKEHFGWMPQILFEDGLRRTFQWYQENPKYFQ